MKKIHKHHLNNKQQTVVRNHGFTLVEVMISVLIVTILATGAMGYQYTSTRDVKISEVQATAARIAMLLLESWKGQQGDTEFDPADTFASEMTIQNAITGPDAPNGSLGAPLTTLGSYEIIVNNVYYYVTLSYDDESESEPMILNATIAWRRDYGQGELDGDESFVRYSTFLVSD